MGISKDGENKRLYLELQQCFLLPSPSTLSSVRGGIDIPEYKQKTFPHPPKTSMLLCDKNSVSYTDLQEQYRDDISLPLQPSPCWDGDDEETVFLVLQSKCPSPPPPVIRNLGSKSVHTPLFFIPPAFLCYFPSVSIFTSLHILPSSLRILKFNQLELLLLLGKKFLLLRTELSLLPLWLGCRFSPDGVVVSSKNLGLLIFSLSHPASSVLFWLFLQQTLTNGFLLLLKKQLWWEEKRKEEKWVQTHFQSVLNVSRKQAQIPCTMALHTCQQITQHAML